MRFRHGELVNIVPKMQCRMAIAALLGFGANTKIALTGVRSRVREYFAKTLTLNSVLFTASYLFPCKNCFPTIKQIN